MRIIHIINSLATGGAEKLILDTVPLYNQKGIKTDVLCLLEEKTTFWQKLEERGFKIEGLTNGSVYNPLLIFKIIPYLKKYDVIHAHLFPVLYWVVLAKWISFSKTKIVYTEHNTNNRRRNFFLFKMIDKIIYRGVFKVVTIADEVDKNIKKHLGFNTSNFKLIENGIDFNSYTTAKSYNKNDFFSVNDTILIQVSSFREQKDQMTLLKAMLLLPDLVKLLLVGDGPLRENCETFVSENKLNHRVLFLGNRMDVSRLLKTADIVILASNHEGLSLSSLEGMASGKPFIASNVPGLKEIVEGFGLLFEKGNSNDLSRLVEKIIVDTEFSNEISKKCISRAKMFDIELMVDKYIKLYKEAVYET